eukprot:GDKJ01013462.1.p1 GENE.GDKJ01013462.1~~GDKJ01013462.1.p1  ORF type:complete len:386 (+),score=104.13 GDKJ01013462.1:23-1180(+)
MSHRKFEHPRCGSLGFLPRKRCQHGQGKVKAFPKDDASKAPHMTAFMGFKAGMTHVVRELERSASRANKRDITEAVTIIETPPMQVVGLVGYIETPRGLRALATVWASHLSDAVKRRFYKNWYSSKKKAFTKYAAALKASDAKLNTEFARIAKYCTSVRAIVHTQVDKVNLGQKKAHIMEVQVNGGSVAEKVEYVKNLFEKELPVASVFTEGDMIDTIAITKGKGVQGVISRWGVTRLPRKTHRGLRKVACIGAWHPSRVAWTVPRAGQEGFHHRTEANKRIYRLRAGTDASGATTDSDITQKFITPMGGFPHYGVVNNDWIMIKGCCPGTKKRVITLRKTCFAQTKPVAREAINLKFIDTSSKMGHGRFQTSTEKAKFFGLDKQ